MHEPTSQATAVVKISSLIPAPVRTMEISGAIWRQRRMTKTNLTAIMTRKIRFYSVPRRKGLWLPLRRNLTGSTVSNVRRFSSPLSSAEETETRDARHLAWPSSMSSRGGKVKLLMEGMRSRSAVGPVSNISLNGNGPGWTEVVLPHRICCKTGRRKGRQNESMTPLH